MKRPLDIERLLQWCYRDELPKKLTSSAEGIWSWIEAYGQRGGVDVGHGAAQRYPHFGVPHPDALAIEKVVAKLPNAEIDWRENLEAILGDLAGLVEVNRPEKQHARRRTRVSWVYPRSSREALKYGKRRQAEILNPPRDVLLMRSLRTSALVTVHASMGTRPDWRLKVLQCGPVHWGGRPVIHGECRGRNLYSTGSYCPLLWSPSPLDVAEARVDYLAWWRGLRELAGCLDLDAHTALPPLAPEYPWHQPEDTPRVHVVPSVRLAKLPLQPQRRRA